MYAGAVSADERQNTTARTHVHLSCVRVSLFNVACGRSGAENEASVGGHGQQGLSRCTQIGISWAKAIGLGERQRGLRCGEHGNHQANSPLRPRAPRRRAGSMTIRHRRVLARRSVAHRATVQARGCGRLSHEQRPGSAKRRRGPSRFGGTARMRALRRRYNTRKAASSHLSRGHAPPAHSAVAAA